MRNVTLLFLVKKLDGKIVDICLAMKKRGFGVGRWNGVGGKLTEGESIEDGLVRETREEIGIQAKKFSKVAELAFTFPHKPDWDQMVHTYTTEEWEGDPRRFLANSARCYSAGAPERNNIFVVSPLYFLMPVPLA